MIGISKDKSSVISYLQGLQLSPPPDFLALVVAIAIALTVLFACEEEPEETIDYTAQTYIVTTSTTSTNTTTTTLPDPNCVASQRIIVGDPWQTIPLGMGVTIIFEVDFPVTYDVILAGPMTCYTPFTPDATGACNAGARLYVY